MKFVEKEQQWFEVLAVPDAVLAVRAETEEFALQKAEYALQDQDNAIWSTEPHVGMFVLAVDENERASSEIVFSRTNGNTVVPRALASIAIVAELQVKECVGQLQLEFGDTKKQPQQLASK